MTIKISTKYKGKKYRHAERTIHFDRIHGGIGWPGERPGYLVVIGERGKDKFLLAEATTNSFGELLRDAVALQQRLDIQRWHTRYVDGAENYCMVFDQKQFNSGKQRLKHIEEPLEANDFVQSSIEMIIDSVASGAKHLHFFKDSALPAELQSLPKQTSKLKITDFPAVSALGFVVSYMDEFKFTELNVFRENSVY